MMKLHRPPGRAEGGRGPELAPELAVALPLIMESAARGPDLHGL